MEQFYIFKLLISMSLLSNYCILTIYTSIIVIFVLICVLGISQAHESEAQYNIQYKW